MTWTECPECQKATYAYGDTCDHCGAAFDGGVLPLFGLGGGPLEHFICRKCRYVNEPEARVCKNCGGTMAKPFEMRVQEVKEAVREKPEDAEAYRELGELYVMDQIRICIHEAGHAVIAHSLGCDPGELSLESSGDSLAKRAPKNPKTYSTTTPAEILASLTEITLIHLGGIAAEYIYDGKPKKIAVGGGGTDMEAILRLFWGSMVWRVTGQDIINMYFNDAMEILEKRWNAVDALANTLLSERYIRGNRAVKIIEGALKRPSLEEPSVKFSDAAKVLREKEKAFLRRFLPNDVRSAHSVLFDFDGKIDFIPSAQELQACLQEYLSVIEEAAQYNCEAVRGCIQASELALGYLGRARGAGIHPPESPFKDRLILRIKNTLIEAKKVHERPMALDGYKRICDIAYLLGKTVENV